MSLSSAAPGPAGPALIIPGETGVKSSAPTTPAFIKNAKTVTRTLNAATDNSQKGAALVDNPEGFSAPVTDGSIVFASADDPEGAIRLESTNGEFVGLRPIGAPKVKPVRSGAGARWVGVVGGSDLVELPTAFGAKGEIVLASAPQKDPVWDFELVLSPGLIPTLGNGEQSPADVRPVGEPIRVRNAAGAIVAEVPAGLAIDAKDARSMLDVSLRRAKNDRWIVSYAVDNSWLRSAERLYPVRVDPSIWRGPTAGSLRTLYEGGGSSAAGFPMMISDQ